MKTDQPHITTATHKDLPRLRAMADLLGDEKEANYFERQLEEQDKGNRIILIAVLDDGANQHDTGYCIYNREPRYALFRKMGIPEIQDINTLPAFRKRGVATTMIAHCESLAKQDACEEIGLGVGLHSGFGAAQRLYAKLGYIPDGTGVNYDRKQIVNGEIRPVDDCLCLMMTKQIC